MTAVEVADGVVRRPAAPWSPAVHALLAHFDAVGFHGAPRTPGIEEGWEPVTNVDAAYRVLGGVRRLQPWAERWDRGRGRRVLEGVAWLEERAPEVERWVD